MVEIIKAETEEEIRLVNEVAMYGFEESPSQRSMKNRMKRAEYRSELDQYLVMVDGKAVVTGAIIPLIQNLRQRIVNMGGIATISSLPEARREGYVSKLMRFMIIKMHDKGFTTSELDPFKETYYARYGYANLNSFSYTEIQTNRLTPLLSKKEMLRDEGINFERVPSNGNAERLRSVQRQMLENHHGMMQYLGKRFYEKYIEEKWIVFVTKNDEDIAACSYKSGGFQKDIIVEDYLYASSLGKFSLLYWFALHQDQINNIKLQIPPSEPLETSVYNIVPDTHSRRSMMVRIINVSQLTGLSVGSGEIKIRIKDPIIQENNKIFHFKSGELGLIVDEAEEEDISLTIQELSAILYGVVDLSDFKYMGWTDVASEYREKLKQLFPKKTCFTNERY